MQFRNLALKSVHYVESSSRAFCSFIKAFTTPLLALLFAATLLSSTAIADTYPERPAGRRIHFVKKAATGNNDGSTWEHAFNYLQDALAGTKAGDEIWIAQGTYYPDEGNGLVRGDRVLSFEIKAGIRIVGGFSGETRDYSRDYEKFKSILSGDLLKNDTTDPVQSSEFIGDNSLNVVRLLSSENCVSHETKNCATILDGLSITSGNANSSLLLSQVQSLATSGGAILIANVKEVHLRNLHLLSNRARDRGGAIGSGAELLICDNVTFENNHSTQYGGAFALSGGRASVQFWNSSFINNSSKYGGAIFTNFDDPIAVVNSIFVKNSARQGGAIWSYQTPLYITGSRFLKNYAEIFGGAIDVTKTSSPNWILNSEFVENECCNETNDGLAGGGGIAFTESSVPNHIINTTFLDNRSGTKANTLYLLGSRVETVIRNSILWNSYPSDVTELIGFTPGTPHPSFESNILAESLRGYVGDDTSNQFLEPEVYLDHGPDQLAYTIDDRITLNKSSPAIDAGVLEFLPTDTLDVDHDSDTSERIPLTVLNQNRLIDGVVDIGSSEYLAGLPRFAPTNNIRLRVYPNPSSGLITIDGKVCSDTYLQIKVLNVLGRVHREFPVFPDYSCKFVSHVDLFEYPNGLYIILVTNRTTTINRPFLIIK